MYEESYAVHDCKLEFIGEESPLNNLRANILEMRKNRQDDCFQFLLGKKFKDIEEIVFNYSIYSGYPLDCDFDEIEFLFNANSIILKFETYCLHDTLPYFSELCVKFNLDCKLVGRCVNYDWYDFYILYKTGKYKHREYTFDELKSNLIYDIRNNQMNLDIWDFYLNKYKFLFQEEKNWMLKKINNVVSSHSTEVLFY